MSWLERYREQAEAWRKEAHAWATHGKESHAKRALEIADVYDAMADEEEKGHPALRITREEVQAMLAKEASDEQV
jgi:hypothetical protein